VPEKARKLVSLLNQVYVRLAILQLLVFLGLENDRRNSGLF
jgi:hypothetical protein